MTEKTMSQQTNTEKAAETEEMERAATARLLVLMTAHGSGQWATLFREEFPDEGTGGEDARLRIVTATLCAAMHCTRRSLRRAGVSWEELRPAFLGVTDLGEPMTERARGAVRRIGRAARLLKRLVLGGVAPG